MLINFTLENWMSFKEPVTFSMVASKALRHGNRVPRVNKYPVRILPIAALYGGNASGKSNFFKALGFAKQLVVDGVKPDATIAVEPFRLDDVHPAKPTSMHFELLIDETIYEFSFTLNKTEILEEKLVKITSVKETELYRRIQGQQPVWAPMLGNRELLKFIFQSTRKNQLFLTTSVALNLSHFRPVYDWFRDTLELIAPDARFEPFELFFNEDHPLYTAMNEMLMQLDTGIRRLGGEALPLPEEWKAELNAIVTEDRAWRMRADQQDLRLIVTRRNGELVAKKLVAYHQKTDGQEIKFEMSMESDGTRRVIDLLPAFVSMADTRPAKVYVIDEIDRSLHTHLTRALLEKYLSTCSSQSRSQMLMTTHDMLLMDQNLLRRDEMWITERDMDGSSTLLSFNDYKDIRDNEDIRKSYLQGRFGGVPRILPRILPDDCVVPSARQTKGNT
ncbi:MAG: ATP-binding protein [Deltaproteobacteria bacterium]|nr:ATP-binding protein [Deltaproteobacteria bacterium]